MDIPADDRTAEDIRALAEELGQPPERVLRRAVDALRRQLAADPVEHLDEATIAQMARNALGVSSFALSSEPVEAKATAAELMELGRIFSEHSRRDLQLSTDHGILLYDEHGLPR